MNFAKAFRKKYKVVPAGVTGPLDHRAMQCGLWLADGKSFTGDVQLGYMQPWFKGRSLTAYELDAKGSPNPVSVRLMKKEDWDEVMKRLVQANFPTFSSYLDYLEARNDAGTDPEAEEV